MTKIPTTVPSEMLEWNKSAAEMAGKAQLFMVEAFERLVADIEPPALPEPFAGIAEKAKETAASIQESAPKLPQLPEPAATLSAPWVDAFTPVKEKMEKVFA